jgi:predicted PurR-regulated permease PerM
MRMSQTESIKRPLKIFLGAAAITLLLVGLIYFRMVVVTAAVGAIGGVLLEPLIRAFKTRFRLPHGVSVAITALLVFCGLGALGYGGYRLIAGQVQRLVEQAPQIKEALIGKAEEFGHQFPWLGLNGNGFNPGEHLQRVMSGALKVVTVGVEGATYALLVMILALFIAANFSPYGRGFLTLFPVERRPRVARLGRGSIRVVRSWFLGQIIVVSITAALTALALLGIGMDYWLLIAALTIILDFIPFLGALLTGAIAVLLTFGTEPDKVGWVLLAYLVIQQLESDVIMPLVMKGRVHMPEAHLLVFVLIMASALGVVGVFLSPPVFAVLHYLYGEIYIPWVSRQPPPA